MTSNLKQWEVGWVCPICGLTRQEDYYDPCLGKLPGVEYACCGHGGKGQSQGYIYFENGKVVRFEKLRVEGVKETDFLVP